MQQIIDINPVEPAKVGFRLARGQAFVCDFTFRALPTTAPAASGSPRAVQRAVIDQYPQIVFRPRSSGRQLGYDIAVVDAQAGKGRVEINGTTFNDPQGYLVEIYTRDAEGRPLELIAQGAMAMTGAAYAYDGPLGPATLPTGPEGVRGPQGEQGEIGPQGIRGGTWTTASGTPVAPGIVEGDMYLDEASGDVWRWSGSAWMRGAF